MSAGVPEITTAPGRRVVDIVSSLVVTTTGCHDEDGTDIQKIFLYLVMSDCLFVWPSLCVFVCLFVCLFVCFSAWLYVNWQSVLR